MKPQDLLLGFRDLLAVFVPGAVFLFGLIALNDPGIGVRITKLVPGADTIVFAALAFGVGSVFYAIGSAFDHAYDRIEPHLINGQRRQRLECFETLAGKAKGAAINKAGEPARQLAKLWSSKSFWTDYLRLTCPTASVELDRLEATQKFFRTFAVVLIALGGNLAYHHRVSLSFAAFAASLVCLGFYAARRAEWSYRLRKWVFLSCILEPAAR